MESGGSLTARRRCTTNNSGVSWISDCWVFWTHPLLAINCWWQCKKNVVGHHKVWIVAQMIYCSFYSCLHINAISEISCLNWLEMVMVWIKPLRFRCVASVGNKQKPHCAVWRCPTHVRTHKRTNTHYLNSSQRWECVIGALSRSYFCKNTLLRATRFCQVFISSNQTWSEATTQSNSE